MYGATQQNENGSQTFSVISISRKVPALDLYMIWKLESNLVFIESISTDLLITQS